MGTGRSVSADVVNPQEAGEIVRSFGRLAADAAGAAHVEHGGQQLVVAGQQREATKVSRKDGDKEQLLWIVDGLPVPTRILQRKGGNDEMNLTLKSIR